jgi:hypothetical protein
VDSGLGQPGVVVDRCVDVLVADPAAGELFGARAALLQAVAAVDAPAAAIAQPADLLRLSIRTRRCLP